MCEALRSRRLPTVRLHHTFVHHNCHSTLYKCHNNPQVTKIIASCMSVWF